MDELQAQNNKLELARQNTVSCYAEIVPLHDARLQSNVGALVCVQVESVQVMEKERDSLMRYIQKQLVAVVPPDMVRQGGWVGLHHSHTPLLLHSTSLSTPPDHASRRSDVLSPSHPPDELLTALKDTEEELERQRAYLDLLLSVVIERDPETLGMLSDVQKK